MDGSIFKAKYDDNYYASGKKIPALTKKFDDTVYKDSMLSAIATAGNAEKHVIKIQRKKYEIVYDGNLNTKGTMVNSSYYFGQAKGLRKNNFVREYVVTLYANNGQFSDNVNPRKITLKYRFTGWNTKKDGTGVGYKDEQEVKNVLIAGKDEKMTAQPDGKSVTLYAMWQSEKIVFPTDITRTGYALTGWSKIRAGDNPFKEYTPDKDTVLYAAWKPVVYKVSLNSNIGDNEKGETGTTG